MTHRNQETGFTLLEIMVVVAIISLLIGMVAPNLMGRVDEAKVAAARSDLSTIVQALEMYRLENHQYPTTQEGLEVLLAAPDADPMQSRSYLKRADVPKDPWGREYLYLSPGEYGVFDVYSLGADGKPGGAGMDLDIGSWSL